MSTHHTPGELKVKIKVAAGLIETRTHEGDDTIVEIEPLDDRESSRQAVEKAREELRGGELMIEVPEQSRFGFRGGDAQVRVTVDAPKGAHINTRTASADARLLGDLGSIDGASASGALFAERVAGDVAFKTASGDLSVEGIGRDANLNTVSGDVRVGSVGGRASVKLVSGDVEIGQAGGDVRVDSVSGDAALRAVSRGETSVKSVSGDIKVGVVAGTKVWLDVNSMSGDTRSDLDPSDAPETKDGESLRLKATSTSGDVRISRAASAAPAG
ncbi:MAG TPA: DUF4097 family beta strand repeat-containing protein [Gaiellales bacterium]|nr:DUF4097 family beta strand repeat-containing protein [Gaiellales bacterium]